MATVRQPTLPAAGGKRACVQRHAPDFRRPCPRSNGWRDTAQAFAAGSEEALSGKLVGGGVRASMPKFIQSSPKSSAGCSVATLPLPQTKASVEQYRSQPQQTRSGWAGFIGNRLLTAQSPAALGPATCRIAGTAPCSPAGCAPPSPRRTASSPCKAGPRCVRHRRAASLDESRPSTAQVCEHVPHARTS